MHPARNATNPSPSQTNVLVGAKGKPSGVLFPSKLEAHNAILKKKQKRQAQPERTLKKFFIFFVIFFSFLLKLFGNGQLINILL